MQKNFEVVDGIYLVQAPFELDLHNNFNFTGLTYSILDRKLILNWQRSNGEWVADNTPLAVRVEFFDVSEFRFLPRDSEYPFTEDNCINSIGYWTDEEWTKNSVICTSVGQNPELDWLMAIDFMSGAKIIVQALSVKAIVQT